MTNDQKKNKQEQKIIKQMVNMKQLRIVILMCTMSSEYPHSENDSDVDLESTESLSGVDDAERTASSSESFSSRSRSRSFAK